MIYDLMSTYRITLWLLSSFIFDLDVEWLSNGTSIAAPFYFFLNFLSDPCETVAVGNRGNKKIKINEVLIVKSQ